VNQFLRVADLSRTLKLNSSGDVMSSSDRGRGDSATGRHDAVPAGKSSSGTDADPYANWLDRMQRARARHAAITKNLYTWSNYKSWADRVKDTWDDEPAPAPAAPKK
jgi:hypothetical protein